MTVEIDRLRALIAEVLPQVRDLRRDLHAHPEIAMKEHGTRQRIAEALAGLPLSVWPPLLGTDFIAELPGRSARTIVLRADMDALPIAEEGKAPWRSQHSGMMHACGHDGHSAILAGAAMVLARLRGELGCTVRFVFQPGEEVQATGRDLVAAGCCRDAAAAYALHGSPGLAVGQVKCREGVFLAAADFFRAELIGKGCHGATPHKGINPIPICSDAVGRLLDLHRRVNERDGCVVTVCSFHAGESSNTVPDTAAIEGTVRYFSKAQGDELEAAITGAVEAAAARGGARVKFTYERKYALPVVNSPRSVGMLRELVGRCLSLAAWVQAEKPLMVSEDFAFYLDGRQGALFFLGIGEDRPPLHTSCFDFNDDALESGILLMCMIALEEGAGE